ncbi:DUF6266 family protein [Sphingobacterium sp.]|uniref:DUF6266 family protein n=1 Tax=Sphingobacterium sp. TaxID=341027 RepID=UPI002898EA48|nr:DUF6266 family protein [Sphingobacterium sp.]
MATINNGVIGKASGKVGAVIASSWKSINYLKGLPKKRTKGMSEEQLIQQERFLTISKFLMPITPILQVGFGLSKTEKMAPTNVAMQLNIAQAITGVYPDFAVDYSKIDISTGSYLSGGSMAATVAAGILSVDWDTTLNSLYKTKADDQVIILIYQPEKDEFMTAPTPPTRADGTIDIEIPAHLLGGKGHVWIFFTDRKATKVSKSSYLGELDLA